MTDAIESIASVDGLSLPVSKSPSALGVSPARRPRATFVIPRRLRASTNLEGLNIVKLAAEPERRVRLAARPATRCASDRDQSLTR